MDDRDPTVGCTLMLELCACVCVRTLILELCVAHFAHDGRDFVAQPVRVCACACVRVHVRVCVPLLLARELGGRLFDLALVKRRFTPLCSDNRVTARRIPSLHARARARTRARMHARTCASRCAIVACARCSCASASAVRARCATSSAARSRVSAAADESCLPRRQHRRQSALNTVDNNVNQANDT